MKHTLLLSTFLFSLCLPFYAQRRGQMVIQGNICEFDTLVHRRIGPGVTYTQCFFDNIPSNSSIPYKMKTHLIAIDHKNPYNNFTPYISKDTYYGINKQNEEVKRRKKQGLKPIASVNGSGFVQNATDNTPASTYELNGCVIENSTIKYANNTPNINYYIDANMIAHVERLKMNAYVKTESGEEAAISQINHYRDVADKTGTLALFCNGMKKTMSLNNGNGLDIILKPTSGSTITPGTNTFVVTNIISGCGHTLASNQCALSGTSDFLKTLKVNEELTIDISYYDDSENAVSPKDLCTQFCEGGIINGVAQPYTWEQGIRTPYAQSAIGTSANGDTTFIADLEISSISGSNAHPVYFQDYLVNSGLWNAMWLDGGPSAEITIDGNFVTQNSIAGFNGRYIPSGFMVYSTAPNDNTITSVDLDDSSKRILNVGESFTLPLYGFNQYGEMIDAEAALNPTVHINCTEGLEVTDNNTVVALKPGLQRVAVTVDGSSETLNIPVAVKDKDFITVYPKRFFTGEGRSYQASVTYTDGLGETTQINPENVTWTRDNKDVVKSCIAGDIVPYIDGFANVIASYNGLSDTISVTVENLEEEVDELDMTEQISDSLNIHIPSVPHSLILALKPDVDTAAIVQYSTGDKLRTHTIESLKAGETHYSEIQFDYDDAEGYPVTLLKINPSDCILERLVANYALTSSIRKVSDSGNTNPFVLRSDSEHINIERKDGLEEAARITLCQLDGQVILTQSINTPNISLRRPSKLPLIIKIQTGNEVVIQKIR